ncbi:MAG TPA: hypothetical protein P5147_27340, partial [Myxococcota bacterium]|nr:hypothetical protein [Myxococcota bacterium]
MNSERKLCALSVAVLAWFLAVASCELGPTSDPGEHQATLAAAPAGEPVTRAYSEVAAEGSNGSADSADWTLGRSEWARQKPAAVLSPSVERALGDVGLGFAGAPTGGLARERGGADFVYGARAAEAEGLAPAGAAPPSAHEARLGVDLPRIRIKRHDAQSGVTLVPTENPLATGPGVERGGRMVYAGAQYSAIVLTPGPRGVKEDVLLTRPVGDELFFAWTLELGPDLEARLESDGVNIYGPSSFLWGEIQIGDDKSRELISAARQNAMKDQLLYRIPAPFVRLATGEEVREGVRYALEGKRLRLEARGLMRHAYPLSIDPTIEITSSADFALGGNNEFGVEISDDRLKRGKTMRGVGAWTATTALPSTLYDHTSVAYNGYLYVIGGTTNQYTNAIQVAPIHADGTVGAWTATTSFPTARNEHTSAAYNGHLYVLGGYSSLGRLNDVQVAPIQADGTIGPWTATTSFPAARSGHTSVAYNGYLYVLGGRDDSSTLNDVQFAPIHANGTVGAWTATSSLPTPRGAHTSVAYNGHLYVLGGSSDVLVAPIQADGTLGAWTATTPFPTSRSSHTSVAFNGYLYAIGDEQGASIDDVLMAPIHADGTVGAWSTTTALPTGRNSHTSVAYNGYLYVIGGCDGILRFDDVLVAPVHAGGTLGSWRLDAGPTARSSHASVVYNGYLYVVGGGTVPGLLNDVQVAPLQADGTVGAWTATTALPSARSDHTCAAYNGYLYVLGGNDGTSRLNEVLFAPINANGTVGAWTATTSFTTARGGHTTVVYNGYLYVLGGHTGSYRSDVQVAPINANGTVGAWTATTSFPTARLGHASVVYNGRLYVLGGNDGANLLDDVQVAPINANGTVGAWTATTSFPTARQGHTSAAYNGHIFVIGGYSGLYLDDVHVAPIRADGTIDAWSATTSINPTYAVHNHSTVVHHGYLYAIGGKASFGVTNAIQYAPISEHGTVADWTATTPLPTTLAAHASAAYNGYLYVLGGRNLPIVWVAPIQADGTVGAWTRTRDFQVGRSLHSSVAYNGFLYVLGGYDGTNLLDDVQVAPIAADGTLGPWRSTAALPSARADHASVATNGFLYVLGGNASIGPLATVMVAPIRADGSLGPWSATTSFSSARSNHTSVAYNGYLYVLGGYTVSYRSDVQVAPINADGTVGAWSATTALPTACRSHTSVAADGYLYVLGGYDGADRLDAVQVAPIHADGRLGVWTGTAAFPTARRDHTSVAYDGHLYVLGGSPSAGTLDDVQVATLRTPSARGGYSKLLDLGGEVSSLDSVTVQGTAAYHGVVSLAYRIAPASGVLGALTDRGAVALGEPVTLGDTNVRYLWLRFDLDDTRAATIDPDATDERDVTAINVAYTGAPLGGACALGSACDSGLCADGVCCDTACGDSATGDCMACSVAAGGTADGTCGPLSAAVAPTVTCRASSGPCDLAETCDSSSTACPANAWRPNTYECRAAAGPCDLAESCTGYSGSCPSNFFQPNTYECRAAAGPCDLAESCVGYLAACPADSFRPSPFECRASAGDCDLAESCTGADAACPTDALLPSASECRAAVGPCDQAESCTGADAVCPTDAFLPPSTECRAAAGPCDLAEACTGADAACPTDAFLPPSTECRAAAGPCDLVEACTGSSASCPAEAFLPSSTECRSAAGVCDIPERCSGSSADCPTDDFQSPSVECRPASCVGGAEIVSASCTGTAATCPALVTTSCAPYACGADACLASCATSADCSPGFSCDAGACISGGALGDPCVAAVDCQSTFCADGFCCDTSCTAQCEACDLAGAEGACGPVAGEPHGDRTPCAADGSVCDGACDGT